MAAAAHRRPRLWSTTADSMKPAADPPPLPHPDLVAAIPRLRRYARVLTGDGTRADDLVQDTLARAWEKRRLWQAGTDLRAWLFTIMHNLYVNQLAMLRRDAANVPLDSDLAHAAWQLPVRANQLERVELLETVQQMAGLPQDQREVLLLAAVEEMQYGEIATLLDVPIGTVMSRLSRARARLRELVAGAPSPLRIVR